MDELWFNSFMADVLYYWRFYFKDFLLDVIMLTGVIAINTYITIRLIKKNGSLEKE